MSEGRVQYLREAPSGNKWAGNMLMIHVDVKHVADAFDNSKMIIYYYYQASNTS